MINQPSPACFEHQGIPEPSSAQDWCRIRADIRRRVLQVLGPFPDTTPPVEVRTLDVQAGVGRISYRREHIRIRSEHDDWITACMLVPTHLQGPCPVVICHHPTTEGAGKQVVAGISGSLPGTPPEPKYSYGLELAADHRFITVCPDQIHDGERVASRGLVNDSRPFYERHPEWSIIGKYVWDTSRIVDYLLTRPDVRPDAIGVIGHSLGAHAAVFSAALDDRIAACVSNGGTHCWNDGERLHWCGDDTSDPRWQYMRNARPFLLDKSARPPFSFVERTALIAPRALFVLLTENGARRQGLGDFIAHLRSVYTSSGASANLKSAVYGGGHGFPPRPRIDAYQ